MPYTKDFSVIVPCWRGAIKFLPKLFDSIPEKEGIEIIVMDNSKEPVRREEILSNREIVFLHSAPERHAGGSRNDGMAAAKGKWLLFADADDYYSPDAFDIFYSKIDSDAELIYTKPDGIYEKTGEHSDRADYYAELVHSYSIGKIDEETLRLSFLTPWCKMVSHEFVERMSLRFDEIRAGNDMFFTLTAGYFAKKIDAVDRITYFTTVNRGSLTQRRDFEVVHARLYAKLKCNQFLRSKGLHYRQRSVMIYLYEARHFNLCQQFKLLKMLIKFRQNPFIGWQRWGKTLDKVRCIDKRDSKYRVK